MAKKKSEPGKSYPSRARVRYAGMRAEVYEALSEAGKPFERSASYMATLGGKMLLAWLAKNSGRSPDLAMEDFERFLSTQ
ncbi:MAG: hypothetical protein K2X38_21925 [Gemmataceae bacterium]|nr:hypothetical protein [Gemmataceae bacterium]